MFQIQIELFPVLVKLFFNHYSGLGFIVGFFQIQAVKFDPQNVFSSTQTRSTVTQIRPETRKGIKSTAHLKDM